MTVLEQEAVLKSYRHTINNNNSFDQREMNFTIQICFYKWACSFQNSRTWWIFIIICRVDKSWHWYKSHRSQDFVCANFPSVITIIVNSMVLQWGFGHAFKEFCSFGKMYLSELEMAWNRSGTDWWYIKFCPVLVFCCSMNNIRTVVDSHQGRLPFVTVASLHDRGRTLQEGCNHLSLSNMLCLLLCSNKICGSTEMFSLFCKLPFL